MKQAEIKSDEENLNMHRMSANSQLSEQKMAIGCGFFKKTEITFISGINSM